MRFIVFGDSKGKENGINKKVLNLIMKETCKLDPKPEFIVMCGDTVAGNPKEELLKLQLIDFKNIIEKYHPGKPLIPVIGNHEVNITPEDYKLEKAFSEFYDNSIPTDTTLDGYNKTVYYVDFEDTRLIVLNSFHYGEIHKISQAQLDWLEKISYDCYKNKLLFVHSPAFPTGAHLGHCLDLYPTDRDNFLNIVEKCNIDIIFCGHEHNYSRRMINSSSKREYIYQVITGGGGEKLRDKYKSKSGVVVPPIAVYHFLLIDIDKEYIKVSAITSKGKKIDDFKIAIR
ncbi:metallophosphoesterase [Clostridium sp. DSM 100503]|uniref:metallophosphoesterase family protein n=1 Tax=Clostridium sp. DSM 100503 TaxID=2963282 RepID=UPI002149B9DC|nr:metallophosphoesterase [Clostridium sp. DSM 100503]MCR1951142.1 metallophosphoesterase [Clostridium sp. DSM 100503]